MQQTYRRCGSVLLLALVLLLPGCSYAYDLILEGQLLAGPEQSPVAAATVTLVNGNSDTVSTVTDQQGYWVLQDSIADINFEPWKDDRYWLKKDRLKLRIETADTTCFVPCPRVPEPKSGGEIYAFVMTVLDAHPVLIQADLPKGPLPLEAVKPEQAGSP